MAAAPRLFASAVVGSLLIGGTAAQLRAQDASRWPTPPPARVATFAAGSIQGVVRDERGESVSGVVVSALGATTTVALTGKDGHFEFGALPPGPYLIRAHLSGFAAPRAKTVQVAPSARSTADIALRRAGTLAPVLAAGLAAGLGAGLGATPPGDAPVVVGDGARAPDTTDPQTERADAGETVWRIRHARRGVLKEASLPSEWLVAGRGDDAHGFDAWTAVDVLGRAVGSPARVATNFFADTPFSGQVNFLTIGSFNTPQQLLSTENLPSNIAYVRVGAPVGSQADWAISGALTQADISSWIVAGSYTTRAPARHRYDVGWSYATQRYDGGNPLALRDISEGSRNAGGVYGYDNFTLSPAVTLTYGGAFARYDYLDGRSLVSPRLALTMSPTPGFRLSAAVARRALAPGAEEFLPPADAGLWLPPQRTFSTIEPGRPFDAERTTHAEMVVERDFGGSTVAFRAFREQVDGQLVTLFGADLPGRPVASLGHYVVGNVGKADATGCATAFRTVVGGRVHGSVEYSMVNARLLPEGDVRYLMLLAPSALRVEGERIHDLSTSIEADMPETATRVLVLYRLSNGFAQPNRGGDSSRAALDGRFDVQVRQALPFMNFSSARWEMLIAVRNFFRETGTEQSVYDELLVVRPPKRVLGGVTLRF